jgi:hypothetical protein
MDNHSLDSGQHCYHQVKFQCCECDRYWEHTNLEHDSSHGLNFDNEEES